MKIYVSHPRAFDETKEKLSIAENERDFTSYLKWTDKPFIEFSNPNDIDKISKILDNCFKEWIKEAESLIGRKKYDMLKSIEDVFNQLSRNTPSHHVLRQVVEENREYYNDYAIEVKRMLDAIDAEKERTVKPVEQQKVESKPIFRTDIIEPIYDILKDFFTVDEQPKLKILLEKGDNVVTQLLFKDSGNRLADTFKKLKEADLILGCQKSDLERWIRENFYYTYRSQSKIFTLKYLNGIVSSTENKCQNPIIDNNWIEKHK